MIFGTVFTGRVKTQEKQCIETKVFCFIIPLYAITTLLVTHTDVNKRRGIEIKSNRTSIVAAVIRPIAFVLWFFSIGAFIGNYDSMPWLLIPAIITTILLVYCLFYFGRTNKHERFVREQFGKQFGLYFMPDWLKPYELKSKFEALKKIYKSKYGTTDWKDKVRNMHHYNEEFSLLYCLTSLENALDNNSETTVMLKDISLQWV